MPLLHAQHRLARNLHGELVLVARDEARWEPLHPWRVHTKPTPPDQVNLLVDVAEGYLQVVVLVLEAVHETDGNRAVDAVGAQDVEELEQQLRGTAALVLVHLDPHLVVRDVRGPHQDAPRCLLVEGLLHDLVQIFDHEVGRRDDLALALGVVDDDGARLGLVPHCRRLGLQRVLGGELDAGVLEPAPHSRAEGTRHLVAQGHCLVSRERGPRLDTHLAVQVGVGARVVEHERAHVSLRTRQLLTLLAHRVRAVVVGAFFCLTRRYLRGHLRRRQ